MMRNYLPYKSAREYVDRGMAKWMGFFLSEHTSALSRAEAADSFPDSLSPAEKIILLYQAYANKLIIRLTLKIEDRRVEAVGEITHLTSQALLLESSEANQNVYLEHIINIEVVEENLDQDTNVEVVNHD